MEIALYRPGRFNGLRMRNRVKSLSLSLKRKKVLNQGIALIGKKRKTSFCDT